MSPPRELISVPGGGIEIERSGPNDGMPLIFQTGTPSAGVLFQSMIDAGAARGIRHVAYSRPGYGRSERRPGRSVVDCVADVAAIADQLGIERFYTVGWSGGGPHALATAALLGDRVIAAATLAGVAPRDAEGLDWLEGMGEDNLAEVAAAHAGEDELRPFLEQHRTDLMQATGAQVAEIMETLLTEVDKQVLTGEFADYLVGATQVGLAGGVWGWSDDDIAFVHDWGFDLGGIDVPVTIWQGEQDLMVPFSHGRWLAAHVAGAEARLLADKGHLSLTIGSYGSVLDELLAHAD
jgi:pimeloyl-ACP methyl ester carboxylesterase